MNQVALRREDERREEPYEFLTTSILILQMEKMTIPLPPLITTAGEGGRQAWAHLVVQESDQH
jgi:hypothetical protein